MESDSILEDTIPYKDSTLELVQHMDSIRTSLLPQIEKSETTEIAVKKTVKREKKLKKELKATKKELKKTQKNLEETKKELAQLKKVAGKKNLLQKVLNIEVDSVEVTDYTVE
tara:strand:- start:4108 stop:4446 length:339 start_codon:yes stop_codon:yes gene_type:complete